MSKVVEALQDTTAKAKSPTSYLGVVATRTVIIYELNRL